MVILLALVAGGCAGVMSALNGSRTPAAQTEEGREARKLYEEALAAKAAPNLSLDKLLAAVETADKCRRDVDYLTSQTEDNRAHTYDRDKEMMPTAHGERTLDALGRECLELQAEFKARLDSEELPPMKAFDQVVQDAFLEALRAKGKAAGSRERWGIAILTTADWTMTRHPQSGALVGRERTVTATAERPDGHCLAQDFTMSQAHDGTRFVDGVTMVALGEPHALTCKGIGWSHPAAEIDAVKTPEQREREREARTVSSFSRTAEELDKEIAEETQGYRATTRVHGRLDGFAPWKLPVRRGSCYVLVWRVDAGGALSEGARGGVSAMIDLPKEPTPIETSALYGPGGVIHVSCPFSDGTAIVDLVTAGAAQRHDLGQGAFTMQVYEKTIGEAKVRAREAERQQRAEQDRARRHERCISCERDRDRCMDGSEPSNIPCSRVYEHCFARQGIRREQCP